MDLGLATSRLAAVRQRIANAARAAGREPESVQLLPVSKTHPPESLRLLHELGLRRFGENYVQELTTKKQALGDLEIDLVFIGTLQSNKIKSLVAYASEIQSLASLRHARLLAAAVAAAGKSPYPVYLIANAGDESTKHGAPLSEVAALSRAIERECPELSIQGLMAIPPPPSALGASLSGPPPLLYRQIHDTARQVGRGLLSLGMSADLEWAIAAGSDCVRIGTALFGERPRVQ